MNKNSLLKKVRDLLKGETIEYVLTCPDIIEDPARYMDLEKIIDNFGIPAAWADSRSGEIFLVFNKGSYFDIDMAIRKIEDGGFKITRKEVKKNEN